MRELKFEQCSQEWHKARSGVVTGTSLKDAVGSNAKKKTLMYKILAGMMTEPISMDIGSKAVERGIEMEPVALRAACKTLDIPFETTGMLFSDKIESYGISPDAVVRVNGKIIGGIEMKCPNSETHIRYMMEKGVPKDYKHQVYAPFLVSDDIQWWYFMSFDDRNYEQPEFYHLVNRNLIEKELEEIKLELVSFVSQIKEAHEKLTF